MRPFKTPSSMATQVVVAQRVGEHGCKELGVTGFGSWKQVSVRLILRGPVGDVAQFVVVHRRLAALPVDDFQRAVDLIETDWFAGVVNVVVVTGLKERLSVTYTPVDPPLIEFVLPSVIAAVLPKITIP